MREAWRMSFVESADAALELLAGQPQDVVVSDIRMPGRSGLELLAEVATRWPQTVRIILSGEADLDTACRAVRVSHQFLSKPSNLDELRATIGRALRLRDSVGDPAIARLVGTLQRLPTLPRAYTELVSLLEDPECSADAVGRVIARDVSLTAGVLRLVNSAYFSLPRLVTDAGDAARLLGFDLLKTLVLGVGIFCDAEAEAIHDPGFGRLSSHALAVTARARSIAGRLGLTREGQELAGMAGMLHDVGELVLALNHLREAGPALGDAPSLSWDRERSRFGASHMEVGAYLLGLWGMHDAVVEVAACHHEPGRVSEASQPDVLTAVYLANRCVAATDPTYDSETSAPLDRAYLARLGVEGLAEELLAEARGALQ
jgi:HD-like signal output (HDOD) protein/CheY-like chemotaxis protein